MKHLLKRLGVDIKSDTSNCYTSTVLNKYEGETVSASAGLRKKTDGLYLSLWQLSIAS